MSGLSDYCETVRSEHRLAPVRREPGSDGWHGQRTAGERDRSCRERRSSGPSAVRFVSAPTRFENVWKTRLEDLFFVSE